MNYKKIYHQLIDNRRDNPLSKKEYGENHHILPRSLGGTDVNSNIVKLTAREHFICHYCLVKMQVPGSKEWYKMYFALNMFRTRGLKYVNSRFYGKLKIEAVKNYSKFYSGVNSSNYGKQKYTNGDKNIFLSANDNVPDGFNLGSNTTFMWCTDGVNNTRIDIGNSIPDGYKLGKITKKDTHIWVTNGVKSTKILKESIMPAGYQPGINVPRTTGYIAINNGVNTTSIPAADEIPLGYQLGLLRDSATKNKIWYTNGVQCIMLKLTDEVPIGFYSGRVITNKIPYKRYTNGVDNITVRLGQSIPDGYQLGLSRFNKN